MGHRSRKRKRLNNGSYAAMTPLGPQSKFIKQSEENEDEDVDAQQKSHNAMQKLVITPGIARAAKIAQNDLKAFADCDEEEMDDQEMKDQEEDFDDASVGHRSVGGITPGIEGSPLQFSGLDLNKGMIEIQNMGEDDLALHGYALSNQDGTMQFELPKTMSLPAKATLRIYVGEELYHEIVGDGKGDDEENMNEERVKAREKIIGDYDGAFVCWGRDVWTGNDEDCARLYNPTQEEVARIEISPDMVDKSASKHGCLMM